MTDVARNPETPQAPQEFVDGASVGAVGTDAQVPETEDRARLDAVWVELATALHAELGPTRFRTWFSAATLTALDDEQVTVALPNDFTRDWIEDHFQTLLGRKVKEVLGAARKLQLVVDAEACSLAALPPGALVAAEESPAQDQGGETPRTAPEPSGPERHTSGLLWNSDVVLNPRCTFDTYVIGPCNRFGAALATGAADQPGTTYNPLFLHGSVGVGKTHLLQALCYRILERNPDSRILYLSCETFVNHFISALEHGDLDSFRNKYRSVDVLVVDDIHLLANKERTQEEFFHTFNQLHNSQKQIVLSSDSPPKDIPTLQDRLVSRFKWGVVAEIEPPCFETRMAIVRRKSRERGEPFPDEVSQLIAEHVVDNVRELEGAVTRLLAFAAMTSRPVSATLAREALGELLISRAGPLSLETIVSEVCERFAVKLSDLQGKRRTASVVWPRQVAMFLFRCLTPKSLEEIGAYFGGRDHSTVLHAIDKVKKRVASDEDARAEIVSLLERLAGGQDPEKFLG